MDQHQGRINITTCVAELSTWTGPYGHVETWDDPRGGVEHLGELHDDLNGDLNDDGVLLGSARDGSSLY